MTTSKELECLNKIRVIIEEYGFVFPEPKKKTGSQTSNCGSDPFIVIKRVLGILKNTNEGNAKEKLSSLLQYLSGRMK